MTVYSINLGIGWASSGVEYAQAYRAQILRSLGIPLKFILQICFNQKITDQFEMEEIIWLYGYFTNVKLLELYTKKI